MHHSDLKIYEVVADVQSIKSVNRYTLSHSDQQIHEMGGVGGGD